jgi:hypothetical protein
VSINLVGGRRNQRPPLTPHVNVPENHRRCEHRNQRANNLPLIHKRATTPNS